MNEEIDWQSRTRLLLDGETVTRLSGLRVGIFGLGGVGSFAAEALARMGIGYLRIVDFDHVHLSNINRQLFALHSTVGRKKTLVCKERIAEINPQCIVDIRDIFINNDSLEGLFEPRLDIAIDAIDSVSSKVNLLVKGVEKNVAMITVMGAASKFDPAKIFIGDISESVICPLARIIRKRLHRRGIYKGIRCVYSKEVPSELQMQELTPEDENLEVTTGNGRVRQPLGSNSYMPAMFGLYAASEVLRIARSRSSWE